MQKLKKWMKSNWWILLIFILIVGSWVSYIFIMNHSFREDTDLNKAGTFGDMFGALNTLFTGLAFVGVVISLFQQNKALEQQHLALNKQQEELDVYKIELEASTHNMKLQRIENTLFNLIEAHRNIVSDIRSHKVEEYHGKTLLNYIFDCATNEDFYKSGDFHDDEKALGFFYGYFKDSLLSTIHLANHNFIFILSYIDKSDIVEAEKVEFGNMLIAQLSIGQKYAYRTATAMNELIKAKGHEEENRLLNKYLNI